MLKHLAKSSSTVGDEMPNKPIACYCLADAKEAEVDPEYAIALPAMFDGFNQKVEHGGAKYLARIKCLEALHEAGFKTVVDLTGFPPFSMEQCHEAYGTAEICEEMMKQGAETNEVDRWWEDISNHYSHFYYALLHVYFVDKIVFCRRPYELEDVYVPGTMTPKYNDWYANAVRIAEKFCSENKIELVHQAAL